MRELKFRAMKNGIEYFIVNIDFDNNTANGVSDGVWEEFELNELDEFTGLKDIDGNEIYENDIVIDEFGCESEVYYEDGAWLFGDGYLDSESIMGFKLRVKGKK